MKAAPALVLLAAIGCSARSAPEIVNAPPPVSSDPPPVVEEAPGAAWSPTLQLPSAPAVVAPIDAPLYAICGAPDAALAAAASRLDFSKPLRNEDVIFAMNQSGDPAVWPRSLVTQNSDEDRIHDRVKALVDESAGIGEPRCGISRRDVDGKPTLSAIIVNALADLKPLPVVARTSQWISIEATMLVPASSAEVVLLGPRGGPKTIAASLDKRTLRARFSVDQPGAWMVQVVATVSTGPRPVLEFPIFAGVAPPRDAGAVAVPGEIPVSDSDDPADAIFKMTNGARVSEGLAPLERDPALDKLARSHTDAMLAVHRIGHDIGDGDLGARVAAAGLKVKVAGENAAQASTVAGTHRALWLSPSHRLNIVFPRYRAMGVGVVKSADGDYWVTEIFAVR